MRHAAAPRCALLRNSAHCNLAFCRAAHRASTQRDGCKKMNLKIELGSKVRLLHDDGWGMPGCVIGTSGSKWRIFWPDENRHSTESACDLVLYESACQPEEVAA
jgi:hypothetical protein